MSEILRVDNRANFRAIALATTMAIGAVGTAGAQESSPNPSLEPGISPQPSPTDVLTGALPCPTPEPIPSPTPEPTPVIGQVPGEIARTQNDNGEIVVVSLPQEVPSPAPSATPDTRTALAENCRPVLSTRWDKSTPVRDIEVTYEDLKLAFETFYVNNPKAEEWVDSFNSKFTEKSRNANLKRCKSGEKGDKGALLKSSRIIGCSNLTGEYYDFAIKYNSQDAMDLSLLARDFAFQSIKGSDVEDRVYEQLDVYKQMGFFSIEPTS